jgi:hypothetical protein
MDEPGFCGVNRHPPLDVTGQARLRDTSGRIGVSFGGWT